MRNVRVLFGLTFLLAVFAHSQVHESPFWGHLGAGPFAPGFRLIETSDPSRSYPPTGGGLPDARPMRIYVWYPAKPTADSRMRLDDYVQMALGDFRPSALPVPLAKGFEAAELKTALGLPAAGVRNAEAAPGRFPVLVLGQGLFYESPLSHFVLCEYLASRGYVVATCPLVGTRYRLANINVEDIETEVRDMEFVRGAVRALPFVDPGRTGVIGYDLGGMAGLIMVMRDPDVGGFLSLDSGILDKHYTGLPLTHPQYREDRFRIPWMHMTQARFIRPEKDRSAAPSLFERKAFGPSYLVHVPTVSHGGFSSYAAMGIGRAVPGFWGPPAPDEKALYEEICRAALAFFDACFKPGAVPVEERFALGRGAGSEKRSFRIEWKKGAVAPPSEEELVGMIIEQGTGKALPAIQKVRSENPGLKLVDESVLNWLGLHFLYWWGRENDAVGVFELNASLYPGSWMAFDSLGEAYAAVGRKVDAIRSYKKSLELNAENGNAKAALEKLSK